MSLPSYLNHRDNLPFAFIKKNLSLSKYSNPRRRYKSPPVSVGININLWLADTANAFTVREMLVFTSKASGMLFPSRSPWLEKDRTRYFGCDDALIWSGNRSSLRTLIRRGGYEKMPRAKLQTEPSVTNSGEIGFRHS